MLIRSLLLVGLLSLDVRSEDWPQFRGPNASSVAEAANLPTTWSAKEGTNIAWKADLPGRGVSGPIVIGNTVVVTASSGPNESREHVLAYRTGDGQLLWHRRFWAMGRTFFHPTSSNAAPTAASDGERIFAFFSSNDLICLDLEGNVQWIRGLTLDHPRVGNDVGMSSSPVVAGNAVVVLCECQGDSFAIGCDRRTGATLWEVPRPKGSNWSSPIAIEISDSQSAVALQGSDGLTLLDANTGDLLSNWEADLDKIPSTTLADSTAYLPSDSGLIAVDVSNPQKVVEKWRKVKVAPGSPSPLVVGDQVLAIKGGGVLVSASAADGEIEWQERLGGNFWATPVVVGKLLYAVNDAGKVFVVDITSGKTVAENDLGEATLGSPAVGADGLYFRSERTLRKIAAQEQAARGLAPTGWLSR
jgi:outer membrane protein assembly factor BamB